MRKLLFLVFLFAVVLIPAKAQGPTYFYVTTAVDVNGFESAFSNQATATFSQGQHIATLTWTAAVVPTGGAAIAGYNVYRAKVSGGPYTKINTTLVTSVTYSDTFVPPNAPTGLAAPTS